MGVRAASHTTTQVEFSCSTEQVNYQEAKLLPSEALPWPVSFTNKIFIVLFFSSSYYLMKRWNEKIRTSMPLHMVNLAEILALLAQIASFIYMIGFFGIDYAHHIVKSADEPISYGEYKNQVAPEGSCLPDLKAEQKKDIKLNGTALADNEDEDLALAVSSGKVPSYSLEAQLGDCTRAAAIRKRGTELMTAKSLDGLPLRGMDYQSILGQCCEMVIGHIQIPVGVAGPLLLDGCEYMVPLATTEGCLVASTNRGFKAIHQSGGASSVLLKDGMTRAPVVRFQNLQRAAELKFYVENSDNFDTIESIFNRTSRFARLQNIHCAMAGRHVYIRFRCSTGDAMGMNMISKGVQNVLSYLQSVFPDLENISVSGNFCADKKPTAVNWIEGRGKSVVCEAVIKEEVVTKVLKTSVSALVELNVVKNLAGSALAGAIGGFNAHASNLVSAVFLATGQDPAQNIESSQCITLMEAVNEGRDLLISVTLPSIEVGTVGGGTQLASQAACLNLLGVKGANQSTPGKNAQTLARIIAGTVLAGELSLMSALAAGQLVTSHLKYNRSSRDINAQNPNPQS
ncbi:hypothetical protein O6H91_01G037200 [Diphasiastrum complanatum]|uniref:Uncharacterized protein n=4 Tax=Diphasiastrum complanatum TaxID=34168 RepID=A0ACC2EQ41_DIPCM|nr:hypothetical protein O6H91_01G037200 [Diphasiastrum complanatum]KAJ7568548.1 hypothetical protein O6H91_01G037200 [Diphasiastrum complanatum]KAJ7568549.1 hypothetical protein O6H91_01G037200 [Diphasiastrum complanatum]KAJ7568550.1 hypothetical protein O6H91_01G037200 [Diphasiastrum complanatum]